MLSHGAKCNMGNNFGVPHILQLISQALRQLLYKAICDNYFIVICLLKSNVAGIILLIASSLLKLTMFMCFVLHVFFFFCNQFVFEYFFSKHLITFQNTYLLSCWFHFVDIFYIKFGFCKDFALINSVTRILLIEAL